VAAPGDRPYLLDVSRLIWRRWAGRLPTGIDRVCLAYLQHYRSQAQAVVQRGGLHRILDVATSERLFDLLAEPGASFRSAFSRAVAGSWTGLLREGAGRGRLYLNVGHTGLDDPKLREWIARSAVRPIFLIHDLIPITNPEFCRDGERDRHQARINTVLDTAAGVIGNSEATIRDLRAYADARGKPNPRAIAAQLGIDNNGGAAPRILPFTDRPYFVVLGTIEARKNHLLLLQIWSRLVRDWGTAAPRLLIIGQRGWECEQVLDVLDRSELLTDSVVELGRCSDGEVATYLHGARALLFPSLAEGYGLPLVEALMGGTPVIASDLPVFGEIAGAIPDYIDPLDGYRWLQAIRSYAGDGPDRSAQLARLQAFSAPTWSGHFRIVDDWLSTV